MYWRPGSVLVTGVWLLLTPPWHGDDVTTCPVPESYRPYAEWTRDEAKYPTEAACRAAKERQKEAFDFPQKGFSSWCKPPHSDSRRCVSTDTLGDARPRIQAPPEKVDVWLRR